MSFRYAGIMKNDVVNGEGICVSVFTQGCPHHCPGCFNPETWDPQGGKEFTLDTLEEILHSISENGVQRNLSMLGGEPLAPYNLELTCLIVGCVAANYPNAKIMIWTGYEMDYLQKKKESNPYLSNILRHTDIIITGPFIEAKKDLTLKWRGSSNQQIWEKHDSTFLLTK